ncbi:fibronectin type III domain-containing protein [Nocardiopsis sp. ARC36]
MNAHGESALSEASGYVQVDPPATEPVQPIDVQAAAAGPTSLNVSWTLYADGGSPITGYTVTVSRGDEVVTALDVPADRLSTTITGLEPSTDYTVVVTATNAVGTSPPSAPAQASTEDAAEEPGTVGRPTATAASGTSVNVVWNAVSLPGLSGYRVTVHREEDVAATADVTEEETAATVEGLESGVEYTAAVTPWWRASPEPPRSVRTRSAPSPPPRRPEG